MKARLLLSTLLVALLLTGLVAPAAGQGGDGASDVVSPGPSLEEQLKLGLITEEQYDQALRDQDVDSPGCCGPQDFGGPDPFGYYFIDSDEPGGPAYNWIDITATGTSIPFAYDSVHGPYPLDLTFTFYGSGYSEVWVSSEGWVSVLSATSSDYSNDCPIPSTNGQSGLLAAFWDDRGPSAGPYGSGFYQSFAAGACPYPGYAGACFVVEWYEMPLYGSAADLQTFEAILFDNGNMLVQVLESGTASGTSATTGIEDPSETMGLNYGCNTAGYLHDQLAILFYLPIGPTFEAVKFAPAQVEIGTPIDYTIVVTNTGSGPANAATVVDPIPAGLAYVEGSVWCTTGSCWYDDLGYAVYWEGQIGIGETVGVGFSADTDGLGCGDVVVNEATIDDPDLPAPVVVQASTEAWLAAWLYEGFEGDVFPPPGWAEIHDPAGMAWTNEDLEPRGNLTGGTGAFAIVDDDYGGSAALTIAELWTPPFDIMPGYTTYLVFKSDYNNISTDESADVDISLDGGATWINLLHWNTDQRGPLTVSIDLTAYAGTTGAIIRFYYNDGGHYAWWWEIDDVQIVGCEPPMFPDIDVSPTELNAELCPDEQVVQELSICNVGDAPLEWELSEVVPGQILDVLWDNGPMVTNPGGGFGGADLSALQTNISLNTYGFGHQVYYGYRMADDFVVDTQWTIDQITFFAYQTNAPTNPSTITGVYYQIWDGPPNDPGSSVVFGDLVTNRLANSVWSNIYRAVDYDPLNSTRPIMADTATGGAVLPPGTYWLDWMTDGTLSSGPWAPPISIVGQTTTGNALQYTTTWAPALDTGTSTQQGMPFVIEGTGGPLPDIPWLSESPISGTVPAGDCQIVDVLFDSAGLTPDVYTGALSIGSNDPDEPEIEVPVTLTVNPCAENTMHIQDISGLFTSPVLVMRVQVADQDDAPLGDVLVEATIVVPGRDDAMRTRYTKPSGWARFWAPGLWAGNYEICVENLTLEGYTYNPDDNVYTCMDWDLP